VCAVARLLIESPSAELGNVAEAVALHVILSDFHSQTGTQRFPGQILSLTPAALTAGHALCHAGSAAHLRCVFYPQLPRMSDERVGTLRFEELPYFPPLLHPEARAHSDILKVS